MNNDPIRPDAIATMKMAISEHLAKSGWTPVSNGTAIASKDYETAVGIKTAHVYLADFGPTGTDYLLQGEYYSKGNNALEPHPFSIPKDADDGTIDRLAAAFASRADVVISETYAVRLHRPRESVPTLNQRVLLIDVDGHPSVGRWVCDGHQVDGKLRFPAGRPESGVAARKWAPLPDEKDARWRRSDPPCDTMVLTLCGFEPTGRIDVALECKASKPLFQYANHPPFAGMQAWMPVDEVAATAQSLPAWEPTEDRPRRLRPR